MMRGLALPPGPIMGVGLRSQWKGYANLDTNLRGPSEFVPPMTFGSVAFRSTVRPWMESVAEADGLLGDRRYVGVTTGGGYEGAFTDTTLTDGTTPTAARTKPTTTTKQYQQFWCTRSECPVHGLWCMHRTGAGGGVEVLRSVAEGLRALLDVQRVEALR